MKLRRVKVEPWGAKPLTLRWKPCLAGTGISRLEGRAPRAEDPDF